MASSNNLIQSLRSAHDPHFKLEGRVGGLEKGMGVEVAKLHKTLSKSFVLQRKTLVRVLGLEGKVSELEAQQAAEDQAKEGIDDILNELGVGGEAEEAAAEEEMGGGTKTKTKPKAKKKPKIRAKKKKIKAKDIGFNSRVFGKDKSGEYLSSEERKRRFKEGKKNVDGASQKVSEAPESSEDSGFLGLGKIVGVIANKVDSIYETLEKQFAQQKDTKEDSRIKKEQIDAKKDESSLEKGGLKKGLEKQSNKVLAPFQSIWDKLINFLTTILFGKAVMKVLDWFGNPENAERVKSFVRFLKDWWPVLLAGIMAFLPALLGPGGMILGTIVLVAWALPKIMDAVKWLGTLPDKIGKFLTGGGAELDKAEKDAASDLEADVSKAESESGIEPPPEPIKLNKGGMVPGSGDTDKVPAMLTPGEFVMSKGAVEKYGVSTMEGLNAAAGGTNRPTEMSKQQQIMQQTDYNEDGSISVKQSTVKERKQQYADMGMPSMELWDGSVVPDIGKIGAEKIPAALAQTRQNMVETGASPENIAKLDELIASPDVQPAALQNSLNRLVPGSREQVLGDMGDSITASAKGYAGGGLVENIFGGAKTMFNMLPQVQAAKFVGGKAQGMFNRGKEFIGKPFDKSVNIPPPMGRKVKVITLPSKSSKNDSTNALIGSAQIPDFQVVHPARRSAKQKTLGITN